ncbi:class F sortase [Nocardioides salsibiostraticola]
MSTRPSSHPSTSTVNRRVQARLLGASVALAVLVLTALLAIVFLDQRHPLPVSPPTLAQEATDPARVVPDNSPQPAEVGRPLHVSVPAIGVDHDLSPVGLNADGSMTVPDFGRVAWYDEGPRPGASGGAVIVAHVHGPDGPDVFWDLATLVPGDEITVEHSRGSSTFVVTASEDVAKEELPYDRIWPDTEERLLRLITCGGDRDPVVGGYPDNTIVYARLV